MKFKILVTFLIACTAILIFYWFQIRPAEVRKQCESEVFSKASLYSETQRKRANNAYRQCLVRKGLSPESIYVNIE